MRGVAEVGPCAPNGCGKRERMMGVHGLLERTSTNVAQRPKVQNNLRGFVKARVVQKDIFVQSNQFQFSILLM